MGNIVVLLFIASLVFAVLFWVWLARGVAAKLRKSAFGSLNVALLLLFGFFGWVCFFAGLKCSVSWLSSGGAERIAEKTAQAAAVTQESVKKGWSAGLLKKLDSLEFELESVGEVEDEFSFAGEGVRTYEASIVVDNKGGNTDISYKEMRSANIACAYDENGVFIPAFVLNHASMDEVPWLLRFLLPAYRKEGGSEYLPAGKSYLSVRFDIPEGHTVKRIALGEKNIDVDEKMIRPLKKDSNVGKAFGNEKTEQNGETK